jgi:hypothetical protein
MDGRPATALFEVIKKKKKAFLAGCKASGNQEIPSRLNAEWRQARDADWTRMGHGRPVVRVPTPLPWPLTARRGVSRKMPLFVFPPLPLGAEKIKFVGGCLLRLFAFLEGLKEGLLTRVIDVNLIVFFCSGMQGERGPAVLSPLFYFFYR